MTGPTPDSRHDSPLLSQSILIVADDLSGASDCAASFASAGARAFVSLRDAPTEPLPILAVDTDSRAVTRDEAVRRVRAALAQSRPGTLVYKKIDSTLRGHLAAELAAALEALPDAPGAVLAPAFPQQGRTLDGGRCFVQGEPLEATALWRHAAISGPADPASRLQAEGLTTTTLAAADEHGEQALAERISAAFASGTQVVICDARNADELSRLARALARLERVPLLVGSAGLARSLAGLRAPPSAGNGTNGQCANGAPPTRHWPRSERPALTVIGSRAPIAREQAAAIAEATGALLVEIPVERLREPEGGSDCVGAALASGRHVVLRVGEGPVDPAHSLEIAAGLARLAAPATVHAGAVVMTGGDTARAVLDALGIPLIEVLGEIEPGVPVARAAGAEPGHTGQAAGTRDVATLLFCLKAGGFGNEDTLLHAVRALSNGPAQADRNPSDPHRPPIGTP
jgi:uncharacterized protein YgbK (DUF1537 family)